MIRNNTHVPIRHSFNAARDSIREAAGHPATPETVRIMFNAGQSAVEAEVVDATPQGMHLRLEAAAALPAQCLICISSDMRLVRARIVSRTDSDLFVEFV